MASTIPYKPLEEQPSSSTSDGGSLEEKITKSQNFWGKCARDLSQSCGRTHNALFKTHISFATVTKNMSKCFLCFGANENSEEAPEDELHESGYQEKIYDKSKYLDHRYKDEAYKGKAPEGQSTVCEDQSSSGEIIEEDGNVSAAGIPDDQAHDGKTENIAKGRVHEGDRINESKAAEGKDTFPQSKSTQIKIMGNKDEGSDIKGSEDKGPKDKDFKYENLEKHVAEGERTGNEDTDELEESESEKLQRLMLPFA